MAALIGFIVVGVWPLMSIPILVHHPRHRGPLSARSAAERSPGERSLRMVGTLLAFLYVWTRRPFLPCVGFTCKNFDDELAIAYVREAWATDDITSLAFQVPRPYRSVG